MYKPSKNGTSGSLAIHNQRLYVVRKHLSMASPPGMMSMMMIVMMPPVLMASMPTFGTMVKAGIMSMIIAGLVMISRMPFVSRFVSLMSSIVYSSPVGFVPFAEAMLPLMIVAVVSVPAVSSMMILMPFRPMSVMFTVMD
ncbi:unnamed protein product [Bursaphelenchus xylophilus]|uniref:(pine wood nematode) hypothetical protein n=1 Tax=Bursaphelenchus xylophilus TaxID=6326 RepID=A0A1I7RNH1_BURXY|nr:unnamed protein product [Bursaphelenchus xylophilus]CAG9124009.1 unnamed protein product [Bursaphelenchus xylophilus]